MIPVRFGYQFHYFRTTNLPTSEHAIIMFAQNTLHQMAQMVCFPETRTFIKNQHILNFVQFLIVLRVDKNLKRISSACTETKTSSNRVIRTPIDENDLFSRSSVRGIPMIDKSFNPLFFLCQRGKNLGRISKE